ncbi:alpha-mannosidase [Lacticaseibacillus chiayiensis]|uniref:Alpha-mannosidase n=1 Tax=Lacticaseibacillus chiayiensis TaxID=2100821 RepID=A0A4Q1UI13_9LACO|nr:glycoside hydrolase family 38 C-terminal domain-containing protein [Lacticaseibacillus chiayiensis]QVI34511.1 alpha-mannosidase [Lacticaseibacillus chiayiensis]RXT30785.1 alpha-mannosidase [Lacticaseibacillus chiayiensis]RXT57916.1 alpha-mannosidase [Lacticaseibacillus chiayiensis]UYN56251.1 alpha-mannosidase [Lacticaseibacillus chiayiensis]
MQKVHVIAHTHWDFEWYFTRQQARVQFAYHMAEVLQALETNQLDAYLLDGQMAIVDDYLQTNPERRDQMRKFVQARRLFVGPWYTQIDEMVTSGESIVRNLQLGHKLAADLGGVMKVGYLPDSFGQGQDMPKIYQGFDIGSTVFWRGMPHEKNARYFYWTASDGSKVLAANIKNGYYAGVELIENDDVASLLHRIATDTEAHDLVLPVGGDQRAVDFNLKDRLQIANAQQNEFELLEDNYPDFFNDLAKTPDLPTYQGEFVDPSASKIHRGIYSSRADLKELYDRLEHLMIDVVEPLMVVAAHHGIEAQRGIVENIWKSIARGQAHDSSGGCNSDETNRDIVLRGTDALQLAESLRDYLLRKLASNAPDSLNVFFWNPTIQPVRQIGQITVATREPHFKLKNAAGEPEAFEVLKQEQVDNAVLRGDPAQETPDIYYRTTIAVPAVIDALDWVGLTLEPAHQSMALRTKSTTISNGIYTLTFKDGKLLLTDNRTQQTFVDPLHFEDGGDAGDTYDYSPPDEDWLLDLSLAQAEVTGHQGKFVSELIFRGEWQLPSDLPDRTAKKATTTTPYKLVLQLTADDPVIHFDLTVENTVRDHRIRLVLHTPIQAQASYADTPFGVAARPVIDPHLKDWRSIGYHEEPTALRPLIHFANTHDQTTSWTFLGLGEKEFQIVGNHFAQLAVTMFRGVGYLGRPDLNRRPGDASGLQTRYVATPDSQLLGTRHMRGGICLDATFDSAELQRRAQALAIGSLGYQNQTLDRFTTPLQYFPINANQTPLAHHSAIALNDTKLVVSSVSATADGTGYLVRLYNPSEQMYQQADTLHFAQPVSVRLLNLNNETRQTLATDVTSFELPAFKPGEIRTYGIYPRQTLPLLEEARH